MSNLLRLAIAFKAESEIKYGRVGRSLGTVKVPLLVHNARSLGGYELWADGIVEIRESQFKRLLYGPVGRASQEKALPVPVARPPRSVPGWRR